MTYTLESLLTEAYELGVHVQYAHLPDNQRGFYSHADRTICLSVRLSDDAAIPVLMHELEHAKRGDDGIQSPALERKIDMLVASRLVGPRYREAEEAVGPHAGSIAQFLQVPQWLVVVYQDTLRERVPARVV